MSNIRFIWNNVADGVAVLTATSSAGALLPANLLIDERAAVWRSTSLSAQTLDFHWSAAQSVDSVCLGWTNLTSSATVQVKGYANVGDGSTVFDQTVAPDTGLVIGNVTVQNWISAAHSIKQLKIVITDAGNPDGYVEVSRAVVGARFSPVVNVSKQGLRVSWLDRSTVARAESGDLRSEPLGLYRRFHAPLDWLEPASRDAVVAMVARGRGRGLWISGRPDASDAGTRQVYAGWAALVSEETEFGYPMLDTWGAQLIFEEMG